MSDKTVPVNYKASTSTMMSDINNGFTMIRLLLLDSLAYQIFSSQHVEIVTTCVITWEGGTDYFSCLSMRGSSVGRKALYVWSLNEQNIAKWNFLKHKVRTPNENV